MLHNIALLALASAVAARPTSPSTTGGNYPPLSVSRGFRLVANVTDPSKDFVPSINNWELSGLHVGPPFNRGVLRDGQGRVFYQNGTEEDNKYWHSSMVTDGSTPLVPYGIQIQWHEDDIDMHNLTINAGAGSMAIMLSSAKNPYSYIDPLENSGAKATFVACKQTIPYYGDKIQYTTINWLVGSLNDKNEYGLQVPENCVPIHLIPECTVLPDLPDNAFSSHEFAQEVRCYDDVSAIDWRKFD
jgi:hypothetical protein